MINFKKLSYRNFMSAGNIPIDLYLDRFDKTLITGKNGSGKSQNYYALYYALYNKSFTKLNLNQMVNTFNNKKVLVEVEFSIGKNEYKVVRGMKPAVFEIWINGDKKEQDSDVRDYQKYLEKNILKMSPKTFKQIVVLGSSSFTPFMKLVPKDRRDVIEDLLDIQYFSVMSELSKKRGAAMRVDINDFSSTISQLETRVEVTEQKINELNDQNENVIKCNNDEISEHQKDISKLEKDHSELYEKTKEIDFESSKESVKKLAKQRSQLYTLKTQIITNRNKSQNVIDFFDGITECPTCYQNIDDGHKDDIVAHSEGKIIKYDDGITKAEEKLKDFDVDIVRVGEMIDLFSDSVSKMRNIDSRVETLKGVIDKIKRNNIELKKTVDFSESEKELEKDKKKLAEIQENCDALTDDLRYYLTVIELLKDGGIKTSIINMYIPVINKFIQKYLDILEFNVEFSFDDQFNEIIKSRGRDKFVYENMSDGERLRIDLSLLFSFRDLSKLKNSSSTNLLIFDEIGGSSLDEAGQAAMMAIIDNSLKDTNVFVISHSDTISEQFANIIKFDKNGGFSVMSFVGE